MPAAADGPIPACIATELTLARSGALDADLIANQAFYGTNFTKPLLFLEDGQYFSDQATADHLTGAQWGVMNETGSYPGQPWLWLYTLWYQVPGFDNSANVDLIAIYLTGRPQSSSSPYLHPRVCATSPGSSRSTALVWRNWVGIEEPQDERMGEEPRPRPRSGQGRPAPARTTSRCPVAPPPAVHGAEPGRAAPCAATVTHG